MSQLAATPLASPADPTGDRPAPPLPSHGSPGRVEMIDAVRGLACLWVLLHHSYLYWVWRIRARVLWHLNDVAQSGYLGVHLFLVISGFVLFFPVVRRHGVRGAKVDVKAFLHRRSRRILPPYYIALALFMGLTAWPYVRHRLGSVADWRSDVLHATILYNLDPHSITTFNGAFWSLALEYQLYLVFPLLLWGCRRAGLAATVGATLVLALVWQSVVAPRVLALEGFTPAFQPWTYQAVLYNAVPGRWFEFAMGMVAAAAVVRPRRHQTAVALAVILVVAPIATRLTINHGPFGPAKDQLWGLVFAATLVLSAVTPPWLARSALVRLTAWAGGISYSIYLLHEPLLQMTQPLLARTGVPFEYRLPVFLACGLPLLVALGFAFHLVAERPFMSATKRPPVLPEAPPPPAERAAHITADAAV
jgi:peptidoglycan/LPS O-acetylase OafA/YrhL